jgi:hypothetical protein
MLLKFVWEPNRDDRMNHETQTGRKRARVEKIIHTTISKVIVLCHLHNLIVQKNITPQQMILSLL